MAAKRPKGDSMDVFVQQLINGITLGSVYAVVALGYTMVYGIIQLINFAHGDVVMIGGMISFTVLTALVSSHPGLSPVLMVIIATLVSVPLCMGLGFTLERVAYKPLRRAPKLAPLITAIGISIILQHLAMIIFTRNNLPYPQVIPTVTYKVTSGDTPATITNIQIAIIIVSIAMMAGLVYLVHRTKLGISMRAVSQNQTVAGLMGVDINRVISYTFMIGAALGAVAGVMWGSYYGIIHYSSGFILGLKAFSAAVLGGIGNLAGAMLGGLLLGVIEALGAGYIGDLTGGWFGSNYQDVFAFLVLIAVLIFRPSGLLGERVGDRA
jgi:branched-chain amino acid transport system permease protein